MNNKIAHLCTSGLSYKILVDKLALLQKRGIDIHIISSSEGYDKELMQNYNFTIKHINMNRSIKIKEDLVSITKMIKLFRKEKYDVVHTHTAKAGIIGRVAAKIARVPLVIHTAHGLPFYEGQGKDLYNRYRKIEKIGTYFCDAIASQNKEDIDKLKDLNPHKPVYYEGNGVDLEQLDRREKNISEEQLDTLRKDLGIAKRNKVILMGARFEPVKDHDFLIEGLAELQQKYKNFVCILAGKGSLEEDIRAKVYEYQLQDCVFFVGHQTEIYPYIKLADIVGLTSEKEGLPRILMEAMAFSKPIVATDVLGTRELTMNQKPGIIVNYRCIRELADAFHVLLTDEELRVRYGEKGRQEVERNFTESKVVDRIVKMYRCNTKK